MKRYLFFFIILPLLFLVSCEELPHQDDYKPINGEGTATITYDANGGTDLAPRVYYLGETPNEYPTPIYQGYNFLGWTTEKNTNDTLYDFTKEIYKDITLYALWESKIKDYSFYLEEYIPDVIDHNLELPKEDGDLILMWGSDNSSLFNTEGVICRPRNDAEVTIRLQVYVEHQIVEYEKKAIIKAIELKSLDKENLVFGYYSSWNFHGVTEDILKTVDVINLSFAYVSKDFDLTYSDLIHVIPKLIECHSYGVRVVVSVQGYSSEGYNFSQAASTGVGRKTLAKNMLAFIEKYNFDGIDIDWEYPGFNTGTPTATDKENYTYLCTEIKRTLKAVNPDYIISAAIPGGPYTTPRFDLKTLGNVLDYIHIMTYDLETSSSASFHTALYSSPYSGNKCNVNDSVKIYTDAGVPTSKICIGVAFYGKYFTATDMGSKASAKKNITYSKIRTDFLPRLGSSVTYYYNTQAEAPYLIDTLNGYVLTYDDERSITAKCNYAKTKKLAGVMIWEIGEDDSDTLLKCIYDCMKK